jgi:Ca2+/H+ antiporter
VTEQVAKHTNGTIGALLNATFGNAPELLISVAALRSGYYRVVQLVMLGSMLTNLMLVFGIACIIGGCRYQVQHIRQTSGNVSVILLLVATAGSLFPAALVLSGQFPSPTGNSKDDSRIEVPRMDSFHARTGNNLPSQEEVTLCRVNAAVMLILYFCYLIFQLGTHKEEFDDYEEHLQEKKYAKRNIACQSFGDAMTNLITRVFSFLHRSRLHDNNNQHNGNLYSACSMDESQREHVDEENMDLLGLKAKSSNHLRSKNSRRMFGSDIKFHDIENSLIHRIDDDEVSKSSTESSAQENGCDTKMSLNSERTNKSNANIIPISPEFLSPRSRRRKQSELPHYNGSSDEKDGITIPSKIPLTSVPRIKSKGSEIAMMSDEEFEDEEEEIRLLRIFASNAGGDQFFAVPMSQSAGNGIMLDTSNRSGRHSRRLSTGTSQKSVIIICDNHASAPPLISLRAGILWLFLITMCISAMSDVLVDTIDGFAGRMHLSEVFTSMVIVPFFSNVAEQVSAFLFAYRNEMDLCVGITVGSAIQIATLILPGSVLIGMALDRNMTLYFHTFETVCLFFGVIVVSAILQGGTTNWLVGVMLVGIYIMFAAGIWFHELEDLDVDLDQGSG